MKDICCYFAHSSKQQQYFHLIHDLINAPKHKMLKLAQPRWLSRAAVVCRILEQWTSLQLFFQSEVKTNFIDRAAHIYKTTTTTESKHMLLCFNDMATTFWYELRGVKDGNKEPKLHLLFRFMCSLLTPPHSSECLERVFSQLNMIKNKTNEQT